MNIYTVNDNKLSNWPYLQLADALLESIRENRMEIEPVNEEKPAVK